MPETPLSQPLQSGSIHNPASMMVGRGGEEQKENKEKRLRNTSIHALCVIGGGKRKGGGGGGVIRNAMRCSMHAAKIETQ